MAYLPLKPAATDRLSNSQSDIQGNFAQANTSFGIDHFEFDDATGDTGKHKHTLFVDLDTKTLVPPVTTADELAIYVKKDASAVPVPALFYRKPTGGQQIQFSGIDIIDGTTGEMPLFGGLQIKWGFVTMTSSPKSYDFSNATPGPNTKLGLTDFTTAVYSFIVSPTTAQKTPYSTNVTTTGFTLNATSSVAAPSYTYWVAIGK